jgi:hypothetical protein
MSVTTANTATIESKDDYEPDPEGQYKYWSEELGSSMKAREKWWKRSDKIVARYLGAPSQNSAANNDDKAGFDLNLFHSNTKTLADMLYGRTPEIDVSRRYAQPNDDVGRVAAEMMERLLNLDVADNGSEVDAVFRAVLQDRLLAGLGCAKVRYTMESEQVPVMDEMGQPMVDPATGEPFMEEKLISEDAPVDYFYWGDILWGWTRTWAEMPWIAFRSYMTKDQMRDRWGDEVADGATYKKQTRKTGNEGSDDTEQDSAWQRAEVWEIWNKDNRKVSWVTLGYDKELEEKDDILGLSGFWPVPPFFIANVTTSLYTPTPDFILAQDLYNEVDKLQTRIAIITEAVRVVGVYNGSADNLKSMFNDGLDNDLIPVENWALFGENGGLAGQVEWLPINDIVTALQQLIVIRDSTIQLLQQITGMSDIMRGQLDNQYEGVGQTQVKEKFASIRVQALEEQFARFGGDLYQIKAEVVCRHFSPETIFKRANMEFSPDEQYVQPAIELIKNPEAARLRVQILPESIAMIDHQQVQAERSGFLNSLSTYMQAAGPIMEADPASKPFILQMLQWGLAGTKGSSEIEGVLDKAIQASEEAAKNGEGEKPDPAAAAAQAAQQLEQTKGQNAMQTIQAKAQATFQARQGDMQADINTAHEMHIRKMAEIEAGMKSKIAEIKASLQADLLMEQAQAQSNIMQTNASVEGEMKKDILQGQIDMEKESFDTEAELVKIAAAGAASIKETIVTEAVKPEPKEPTDG